MKKNKAWIIVPKVNEFVNHLEGGLAQAGLAFEQFFPKWVQLEHVENKAEYNGLVFSQVPNCQKDEFSVCVAPDGIHFAGENTSILPFSFDQPPSKIAILFLVTIIKGDIVNPPCCPKCQKEKDS
mgnify:CR=1 FL=1|tara:strand:+ start:295 stop:669 length:375 start_codon:yes stop_codon:yes gene_type:complete